MSNHLIVNNPGLHTTLQDLGRVGYLNNGVPPSGAVDPINLRLANALVGNKQNEGCLEILYGGAEFSVGADTVQIALCGEDSFLEVLDPEKIEIANGRSVTLERGDRFRVVLGLKSPSAYLAVSGGFDVQPVMGSVSTYVRGEFGGFSGRPLRKGDGLPLRKGEIEEARNVAFGKKLPPITDPDEVCTIRIVLGPQEQFLTETGTSTLLNDTFVYSRNADRMGIRLDGPTLGLQGHEGFVSDGIIAGAIQVPGSGQPIILMADHQTSGGYPKVATVISADLPILGRLRPERAIRFEAVSVNEAQQRAKDLEAELKKIIGSINPIEAASKLDVEKLYTENLLSGVVSIQNDDD